MCQSIPQVVWLFFLLGVIFLTCGVPFRLGTHVQVHGAALQMALRCGRFCTSTTCQRLGSTATHRTHLNAHISRKISLR